MTALPPVNNTIRVALNFKIQSIYDAVNIFHVNLSSGGPYSTAELDAWAKEVLDDYGGNFMPNLSNQLQLLTAEAKDISSTTGAATVYTPGSPVTGSISSNSMAANVSACVSWSEGISYRGGHARTYVPGPPINAIQDAAHFTSGFAAALATSAAGFRTSINTGVPTGGALSGTLVVVHYARGNAPLSPPEIQAITGARCNTRFDSQRRRLGR